MKKSSWGTFFFCVVVLLFYGMFCFIVYDSASKIALRNNTSHVSIKATISSVDHYTEFDEGFEDDRWKSYVSYDYNGEHYSYVYYSDTSTEPKLGKTVTVLIDPDNPGQLLPDNAEYMLCIILAPLFLTILISYARVVIRDWLDNLMAKKEGEQTSVEKEHSQRQANYIALFIIAGILALLSLWFYVVKNSFSLLIISGIALVISICFALRKPKSATKIEDGTL